MPVNDNSYFLFTENLWNEQRVKYYQFTLFSMPYLFGCTYSLIISTYSPSIHHRKQIREILFERIFS